MMKREVMRVRKSENEVRRGHISTAGPSREICAHVGLLSVYFYSGYSIQIFTCLIWVTLGWARDKVI